MTNKELEQKIHKATSLDVHFNGKKPFTPSPVISPVYGILDKNYTKDEIIDKKDGLKRERVKPIITEVELVKKEEKEPTINVDIDSIRNKAFGELEDLETNYLNERKEQKEVELPSLTEEIPIVEPKLNDEEIVNNNLPTEDLLDNLVEEHFEEPVQEDILESTPIVEEQPKVLDDLEKTSTLQILDDIEKELNSIKPVQAEIQEETKDDSIENELFDLIDSMYESGEEESDD